MTQFSIATTEYAGNGKERPEYHNVVVWDRLAEVCGRYLGKGQQVAIEGRVLSSRIETRPRDAPSVNWRPTPSSSASSAAYPRDGRAELDRQLTRSFEHADETAQAPLVRSEIVHLAGITVSRDVQEPGWRWSSHVKPIVQTEWCRFRHLEYAVRGRLHVQLEDGYEYEIVGGQVAVIPPGHDAWVVGDEPFESIAWSGVRGWLGSLEPGVERVVLTLVMTDIVESTPAATRMGDRAWGDALAHFVDGARDTIASYRGQLVSVTGDGVLARFDGAGRALRCALRLRTEAATFGLPIRAAVHTGEVEVAEADLRGVALHETARMLSLAGANEIIVSATTKGLASASELHLVDLGERELRGLPDSYHLYRLDAP